MSSVLDTAFTLIRQLQGALDGKTIRTGVTSVTFTAATSSATTTVTHGLGENPTCIQLTCESTNDFRATYSAVGSTTFAVKAHTSSAATGALNVSWTASA